MDDNGDDDGAFLRQYAAEIARFLREQEDSSNDNNAGRTVSIEESTRALYRALCFDEPLLDGIPNLTTTASALCRQLVASDSGGSSSRYALSNRLVNGIVYLCRQRSNTATNTSSNNNDSNDSAAASNATNPTTAVALAKLAFCVLIQVPLECCQVFSSPNTNSSKIQALLGSYKGAITTETTKTENHSLDAAAGQTMVEPHVNGYSQTDQMVDHLVDSLAAMGTKDGDNASLKSDRDGDGEVKNETSPLQEVWAEESDPSEYDYGEGDAIGSSLSQGPRSPLHSAVVVDFLDPMVLSQADTHLTVEGAKSAVGSLLQQANYTMLAPIFQLSKKQVEEYFAELTQLILLLLQPPQSMLLSDSKDESSSAATSSSPLVQDAILAPLWILRDAALHHPSEHIYTTSYLEVLQTLLAVDQAYQADLQKQQPQPSNAQSPPLLCSASIVGLSALSSWCSSADISTSLTVTAILDAMNDLAHVMERASESGYQRNLLYSMTPIVELLTGITFQDRKIQHGVPSGSMVPQTILNSGLLRQLLVLALDAESATPPYYLDHALWGLCVVYPTVVGKYVARYPGFPKVVRRYHRTDASNTKSRDFVQSILWNCFAMSYCQDGSQPEAPRMVWRTKAPTAANGAPAALTKDECREVCEKSWVHLCGLLQTSLDVDSSTSSPKQALEVVRDWERLLKLAGVPSVVATFQSMVSDHDIQLQSIRSCIAQASVESNDSVAEHDRNKDEKLDDEDAEDRKKSSMTSRQLAVATARKTLKQYTLFFQGNAKSSSKTD